MKKKQISFKYDADVDAAYLTLTKAKIAESQELCPGVVMDVDASRKIVGIEILRFMKRFKAFTSAR